MAKRGRKTGHSGHYHIANAERLFLETRDFRYVALAIGQHPYKPPSWAIEACIAERLAAERTTSATTSVKQASRILDLAVALMAHHEEEYFKPSFNCPDEKSREDWYSLNEERYKFLPLETALRQALLAIDPNPVDVDGAVENLVNAWKREQQEEESEEKEARKKGKPIYSALPGVQTLRAIKPTKRITRVLNTMEEWASSPDSLLSSDPELLLWRAKSNGLLPD
jgi:hypothetical protein